MSADYMATLAQSNPELYRSMVALNPTLAVPPAPFVPTSAIPPVAPAAAFTPQQTAQIQQILQAELQRAMPGVHTALSQFDAVFQRALAPTDFEAFKTYVAKGAPGFDKLLAGEALLPIVQLLWETMKEHAQ